MADLAVKGVGIVLMAAFRTGQIAALRGGEFGQTLIAPGHGRIVLMAALLTFHDRPQLKIKRADLIVSDQPIDVNGECRRDYFVVTRVSLKPTFRISNPFFNSVIGTILIA